MSSFKIISEEYYSNCLIEAIRAKIHNPQIKIYKRIHDVYTKRKARLVSSEKYTREEKTKKNI